MSAAAEALTPEEQAELDGLVDANTGRGVGLVEWITQRFPDQPPPEHIRVLCEVIERARRERVRVCVSMPPRHAKSTTILRAIAWWLLSAPADTCAYVSYSDRKARSESRKARRIAQQAGIQLASDSRNMAEWRTLQGGGLLAAGAKGGLTGYGVQGLMVVDDPYSGRKQADSSIHREDVWDWFNEVVYTRLEKASVIAVSTRWHEDDLIGRLSKDSRWEVINLPAIAESDDDIVGRAAGEALWPELYPIEELANTRAQIGEWSFASLYQGRPRPRGACVFGQPTYYDPLTFKADGCRVVIGGDPNASEKTTADHGVLVVLAVRGFGAHAVSYVLHVFRKRMEVPEFIAKAKELADTYWNAPLAVEAVAGFKSVPQMLKQIDPKLRLLEVKISGDKWQRAQAAASAWNDGRLQVPTGAAWLKAYLHELGMFTGVSDAEDDQCLVGDTRVLTLNGEAPISEVRSGDHVLTRSGWCCVTAAAQTGIADTIIAHLSDGNSLEGTIGHPVYVDGRGFSRMDALEHGCVVRPWLTSRAPIHVVRISSGSIAVPVFNLAVAESAEFFANGILVHNCDATAHAFNAICYEPEPVKRGARVDATRWR